MVCVTTTILGLINESQGVTSCNRFERVSRTAAELHSTDETLIIKKNSNVDITPENVQWINILLVQTPQEQQTFL
jgi:hypothetical protein